MRNRAIAIALAVATATATAISAPPGFRRGRSYFCSRFCPCFRNEPGR